MKATKLIELLSHEVAKASLAGYSDVEVQITSERPTCGQCVDVARVIFAEEVIEEEDIETGKLVEHSTGNKAIFLTEGGEPETNRYNFIERESN
tara:strand:+ start:27 stop:308 length:282 start_codon:yes stop_codon:yes gene_type:complete